LKAVTTKRRSGKQTRLRQDNIAVVQMNPFLLQMVDEILFYEWDVIGINQHLTARDEYAAYAGDICRLLEQGVEETKLAHHLTCLARQAMGLSQVDEEHNCQIARRLLRAMKSCEDRDPRWSSKGSRE
jgi:hypothetical protein